MNTRQILKSLKRITNEINKIERSLPSKPSKPSKQSKPSKPSAVTTNKLYKFPTDNFDAREPFTAIVDDDYYDVYDAYIQKIMKQGGL